MQIFIYLRRTQDYKNCEKFLISNELLNLWNNTCSISYQEYREAIKKIAINEWKFPIIGFEEIAKLNDEDIILPSDDDDWFHPLINNELLEKTTDFDFGYWNTLVSSSRSNFGLSVWFNHHKEIASNGYFVKTKVLKNSPDMLLYLNKHMQAERLAIKDNLKILNLKHQILSVYNWHPGSFSVLKQIKNKEDFCNVFPKNQSKSVPKAYNWAKNPIEKFNNTVSNINFNSF